MSIATRGTSAAAILVLALCACACWARVLDLMGNEMTQPVLHSGEPFYVVAPQLPCGQLEPRLNSALTANDERTWSRGVTRTTP